MELDLEIEPEPRGVYAEYRAEYAGLKVGWLIK